MWSMRIRRYTRRAVTGVGHIFRWDLDKTYLRTDFSSLSDIVRTARLTAEQRENIPGSRALIHALRDGTEGGPPNLIYFISGSPNQLRSVLEKKFRLDGFAPDGFVLKPSVSMFLRGRFRAIRGQLAYKLGALLRGRADAPIGTAETLLGDDAESDAFIYSLYADVLAGKIRRGPLVDLLRKAGAYDDEVAFIEHELDAVVHEDVVRRVIIHLDQLTPPATFVDYFPLVVPIYNHLQTAVVLYLDGAVQADAVRSVAFELIRDFGFDATRLTHSGEDILRRRRVHYPLGLLDALASDLRALPEMEPSKKRRKKALAAQAETAALIERIAERAVYLRGRPLPRSPDTLAVERDYAALWAADQARREEARRARKNASKR